MANPLYDALFGGHAGKKTVFLHLADGGLLTHDAFLKMAARFAHVLVGAGLQPGDRLAAQIGKSPEALAIYSACVQTGVIFLPLKTDYTAAEMDYFVGNSGAKLVLGTGRTADALRPIAEAHGAALMTLNDDGSGRFAEAAAGQPEWFETVDRRADDLAAFLYTSGTTGRSKGAMLTQGNLLSNARALADCWGFTAEDVLLHALPVFHTHGLFVATNITLLAGGSMIFLPRFDLDAMPRATTMMGVPTFYTRLLDDPRLSRDLTRHMRLFVSGSAPLLAETHHQFQDRHRADPDRDHDAEREVETHQRVALEPILGQREGRHGAEQEDEEQRGNRDDHRVLEVAEEVALPQHGFVADQAERVGVRHRHGLTKDRAAGFEAVDQDHEDREERDDRVDDQDGMHRDQVGGIAAGLVHQNWYLRMRVWIPKR